MPEKSRGAKTRSAHTSKKSRAKLREGGQPLVPPAAVASADAGLKVAAAPVTKIPAPAPTAKSGAYPYIASEMSRIGIMAVIIIVVLVVLSMILT